MKRQAKWVSLFLSASMVMGLLPTALAAGSPPEPTGCREDFWNGYPQLEFSYLHQDYLEAVTDLWVDGTDYSPADGSFLMEEGAYYVASASYNITIGIPDREDHTLVIGAEGYEDLTLALRYDGGWSGTVLGEEEPDPEPTDEPEEEPSPSPSLSPEPSPEPSEAPEPSPSEEPAPGRKTPPAPTGCETNFGYDFKLTFTDQEWVSALTSVLVGEEAYSKTDSSYGVWNNTNYYAGGNLVYIGEGGPFTDGKALCVITADGYEDLTLELDRNDHTAVVRESDGGSEPEPSPQPPAAEKKPAPDAWVYSSTDFMDSYYVQLEFEDAGYVSGITGVSVNDTPWLLQPSKMGLSGQQYHLDTDAGLVAFNNLPCPLRSGDLITITNPDYETLTLKVTIAGSSVSVAPAGDAPSQEDAFALHVRLVGFFEAALVNQKGYDAISGASTNITQNQNSNVVVEAALTAKGQEPSEEDWTLLAHSGILIDTAKTSVKLDPLSGMAGMYSSYDSSLTLAGTPATAGTYPVSVTITDDQGRTAVSNELIFKVYSGEEYLEDQLVLDNCVQTADGKYMYDMEPWAMKHFDPDDNTVTVPADIKAWYGSHTSGTYGELGYSAQGGEPVQTLILPAGCNLTLVNMKLYGSVRVVVEAGARLTLRDSSVHGVIDVMDGGVFSMNYDEYSGQFLTGASLNGQLRLHDGATVENAIIYSHTNYLSDNGYVRVNDQPVVTVDGDVTFRGQVFLRGDEAATGAGGQPGLAVRNGTLTIPEGSALAVYGGGYSSLTTTGGDAISLDHGTIAGGGKLVAIGGWSAGLSDQCAGGSAVSGTGTIAVSGAYLEGGSVSQGSAGKALTGGITLSDHTDRTLADGTVGPFDYDDPTYWQGTDPESLPDLTKDYPVENNAPGQAPEQTAVILDGRTLDAADHILDGAGHIDFSDSTLFPEGDRDAYLLTLNGKTQLVGDTTLKRWVGKWESWENFIYPDDALSARYPYLEQVWEEAYAAYMAAFQAAGVDMSSTMPDVAALKAYWAGIAGTKGVGGMEVAGDDSTGYTITWKNAAGEILCSDRYEMTGKMLKGFEGAPAYVFTAQTLAEGDPYKYFISMLPGMEGTEEAPIAAHFHFQFGGSLSQLLIKGELHNSSDYGTAANGRPIGSNLADSRWYATMTDAQAAPLANYNVILGMHRAEKWTSLPGSGTQEPGNTGTGGSGSSSGSSGSSRPGSGTAIETLTNDAIPLADAPWRNPFIDVAEEDWFYDTVRSLHENRLMIGTGPDTFSPGMNTTLGMALTVLYRLEGCPAVTEALPFSDVAEDDYCADAIRWAIGAGICHAGEEDLFHPETPLTLEELETLLQQYLQLRGSALDAENLDALSAVEADAEGHFPRVQAAVLFLYLRQTLSSAAS